MARKHFGDVTFERDNRDVEGSSAQIVDHGGMTATFAICQACGCRLIQNANGLKTGQSCGLARGLALRIGEIRGNGNDRLLYGPIELQAGPGGKLAQDQCRDFGRRKLAVSSVTVSPLPILRLMLRTVRPG